MHPLKAQQGEGASTHDAGLARHIQLTPADMGKQSKPSKLHLSSLEVDNGASGPASASIGDLAGDMGV